MPPTWRDSESAAMFKQLITRPLAVPLSEEPEDIRLVQAFCPLSCSQRASATDKSVAGTAAFSNAWLEFSVTMQAVAMAGRRRFLSRFEYPSLWETEEVHRHLESLYDEAEDEGAANGLTDGGI